MSGPKTTSYSLTASLLRRMEEEARRRAEQRRRELEAQRYRAVQTAIADHLARLDRVAEAMREAVARYPNEKLNLPQRRLPSPTTADIQHLEAHRNALDALANEQEQILAQELGRVTANAALRQSLQGLLKKTDTGRPRTATEVFAVPTPPQPGTIRSAPLLGKLDLEPGEQTASELMELAERLDGAAPSQAQALETELRYRIQQHNQGKIAARQARAEAAKAQAEAMELFVDLPEPFSTEERAIADHLQRVALGETAFATDLRAAASAWKERAIAQAERNKAAQVLRQSLEDLGYEVEEGFATLFVERGLVHFTRPDWGGYYVRLRTNSAEHYLNFNLVRAAAPLTLEQERRDREAEESWCRQYRPLLQRLAAEGLDTKPLRELPAGTLSLQTLAPDQLVLDTSSRRRQHTPVSQKRSQS